MKALSHPLALSLAGGTLLWLALPPLEWWPLAWIAPVFWLVLIRQAELPGRRPYLAITAGGVAFWMAAVYWIMLPHWTAMIGWLVLAGYLGLYLPAFVAISRAAVHRLGVPLMVAAPVVWTGLELVRAYLLTGFLMAALGHTQYRWIELIQISDLVGAYGVSFVVMFVAACFARALPLDARRPGSDKPSSDKPSSDKPSSDKPRSDKPSSDKPAKPAWWPLAPAAAMMAAVLAYGYWRTGNAPGDEHAERPPLRVALIQGTIDTEFGANFAEVKRRTYTQYLRLSRQAIELAKERDGGLPNPPPSPSTSPSQEVGQGEDNRPGEDNPEWPAVPLDLIVWPESMYRWPLIEFDVPDSLPRGFGADADRQSRLLLYETAQQLGTPLMLGVDLLHYRHDGDDAYNGSLLIEFDRATGNATLAGRYAKMHLVPFGEYLWFGETFPWLYTLTPLGGGLTRGARAESFTVRRQPGAGEDAFRPDESNEELRISPSICFESVVPHLIRGQVLDLRARGKEPDVLVTQTNDGWFWGSAALDMHLVCGVFRAIEMRKPLLTAANTGISAWIDGNGRIIDRGPKREEYVILAEVSPDVRQSPYLAGGDWFAWLCLAASGAFAAGGVSRGRARG